MSDIGEWLSTSRIESYYDSGMTPKSTKTEICTNGGMAKNNTLIQDHFSFFQEDRLFVSSTNHNREQRSSEEAKQWSSELWLVECTESSWDGEPEYTFPTKFFGCELWTKKTSHIFLTNETTRFSIYFFKLFLHVSKSQCFFSIWILFVQIH